MANERGENPGTLIVVAGPTAVGKTDLAIRLAQHLGTEILSADSRQFYREMTIGTAKPLADEQGGVRHHFVDSHSITEIYSAGRFEQEGLEVLQQLFENKDMAVLVGGSGLYVRALCEGMDQMPQVDPQIRKNLIRVSEKEGTGQLLLLLRHHDPAYYELVDKANTQRLIRALEVSLSSGRPYSSFRTGASAGRPFRQIKIGLNRPREELYARIDLRMQHMLAQGLVEEAKALYPFRAHNALQTVGYQEVFGYMEGNYPEEEMVRLLKRNSRRYAKRQLTWFRKDPEFTWFHPDQWEEIRALVELRLRS